MLPSADSIGTLLTFLEESCPSPLTPGASLEATLELGAHSLRSLRELDEKRLVVGLLGGTGVGKSTLLNAIAGHSISQSGARRPTTDRIVCYRHTDFDIPSFLSEDDLATPPPPHQVAELRGVTILDLPDIDSCRASHRERVHRALPHLDLLIVVTSIDKYADRVLHDELRAIPQATENSVLVLNAIDRLHPHEIPDVTEDFAAKVAQYAGWKNRAILPMSAKLAGERSTSPDRHGLAPLLALMEELGGDARRRQVLVANAREHLSRFVESLDRLLPPERVEDWIAQLEFLAGTTPTPSATLVSTFAHDLEQEIGPWMSDVALRSSSFPIGWLHFLTRRWRPGASRIRDPFRSGHDPGRPYAEELLERPLRLAAHRTRECLRGQLEYLSIDMPSLDDRGSVEVGNPLQRWSDRLQRRAPRLGWKFRHHALPLLALLATLGWVAAPAMRARENWRALLWDNLWATVERLSPLQWSILAIVLTIYYGLSYPYLLYRLERRIEREATRGVDRYLAHFESEYRRVWSGPLSTRVAGLRAWWRQYTRRRSALGNS